MQKRRTCNICGNDSFKTIYRLRDFNVIRCQKCSTLCRDIVFERAESEQLYSKDYFCELQKEFFFGNEKLREKAFRDKMSIIDNLYPRKGKLLDIGCATGMFLKVAKKGGWCVQGVEISRFASDYAIDKEGLNVHNCDLLDVKAPSSSFDVVTMWDAVDHSESPSEIIGEVYRILKPGGIVALDTFMVDGLLFALADCAYKLSFGFVKYPSYKGYPLHHSHYFSRKTIKYLLKSHGFEIILQKGSNLDEKIVRCGFFGKKIVGLTNLLTHIVGKEMEMLIVGRKSSFNLSRPHPGLMGRSPNGKSAV